MSFIVADEITIVGMFSPNGFETIKPGAAVKLVFDELPGRIFHAEIVEIPRGVGQGQIAVSGMLARVGSIGGATRISGDHLDPEGYRPAAAAARNAGNRDRLADNAGVIGVLMSILVWISSYTAYL